MKKSISLILACLLSVSFVMTGCNTQSPSSSASVVPSSSSSSESTPAPSAEEWKPYDKDGKILRTDRDATGTNGVVATAKVEASRIGVEIIEQGGNAIDAAVAVAFALGVCEPQSSGIGGGGFMMLRSASGETDYIDFREVAPAKATPEMWQLDKDGKVIGDEKRHHGKSSGVPGEVKGLLYALENFGTMTREQVMAPAIKMAEEGYTVSTVLNGDIKNSFDFISKYPATKAIYLNGDFPYEVGATIKNPDLAKSLKAIQKDGESAFYTGPIAEAMVKSVNEAGGYLSMEDLKNYDIKVREPLKGTYRGYDIITVSPPSSGGAHIIQILNILENHDMKSLEVNSTEYIHVFSEAIKMAFADRAKFAGDTDFVKVPINGMISKEYAKELYNKIDMTKSQDYTEGNPLPYESDQTTSYSIMDKEGNMVAVTKTVNGVFASGVVAEGTGILMNNQMDDFNTGAGTANSVEPGKKPLSSMSPTLILKDGKPFMSLGAPGATKIIPGLAQVISKVIDHDMDVQDAITNPRFNDSFGNLQVETRIDSKVAEELKAMGHKVAYEEEWFGYPCVQAVTMKDGQIRGGADPRRDGKALAY